MHKASIRTCEHTDRMFVEEPARVRINLSYRGVAAIRTGVPAVTTKMSLQFNALVSRIDETPAEFRSYAAQYSWSLGYWRLPWEDDNDADVCTTIASSWALLRGP